jgi:DNA replication protein DnaC
MESYDGMDPNARSLIEAQDAMSAEDGEGALYGLDVRALADRDCRHCRGVGYRDEDDGGLTPRQHLCRCVSEAHRRNICDRQILHLFGEAGATMSFDRFDADSDALNAHALKACLRYVQFFQNGPLVDDVRQPGFRDGGYGFALVGPPGSGKTHLATATLMALIKCYGGSPAFLPFHLSVPELMEMARARIRDDRIGDVLSHAKTASVYLLDDIGAERHKRENGMSWVDEQLFIILNYRLTHNLPTIYTSNLSVGELEDVLDERVASRLKRKTLQTYTMRIVEERLRPPREMAALLNGDR